MGCWVEVFTRSCQVWNCLVAGHGIACGEQTHFSVFVSPAGKRTTLATVRGVALSLVEAVSDCDTSSYVTVGHCLCDANSCISDGMLLNSNMAGQWCWRSLKYICTAIFIFHWISFLADIKSLNLALRRPCGCEESDAEVPYLQCYQISISWEYSRRLLTIVTVVQ